MGGEEVQEGLAWNDKAVFVYFIVSSAPSGMAENTFLAFSFPPLLKGYIFILCNGLFISVLESMTAS